jgi:hypothetical protein
MTADNDTFIIVNPNAKICSKQDEKPLSIYAVNYQQLKCCFSPKLHEVASRHAEKD